MSSHPGSTINDAIELAVFLKENGIHPEQVQDYYPTPGTISTAMFYCELDPYTLEPVFVAKKREDKAAQRALLQYYRPENRRMIIEALIKAKREDLIGQGKDKLVSPDREYVEYKRQRQAGQNGRPAKGKDKWQKQNAAPKRGKAQKRKRS